MHAKPRRPKKAETGSGLSPQIRNGLGLLLQSLDSARQVREDPWQFAVEAHLLEQEGLTPVAFRWLLSQGLVEHRQETTRPRSRKRTFARLGSMMMPERTCFVLTKKGEELARKVCQADRGKAEEENRGEGELPHWDGERRELRWKGQIVKRYKVPAQNQEVILAAFEEEGWPAYLDDPLPQDPEIEPKVRLHNAIRRLNEAQRPARIRFQADGTGQGIVWEARD